MAGLGCLAKHCASDDNDDENNDEDNNDNNVDGDGVYDECDDVYDECDDGDDKLEFNRPKQISGLVQICIVIPAPLRFKSESLQLLWNLNRT